MNLRQKAIGAHQRLGRMMTQLAESRLIHIPQEIFEARNTAFDDGLNLYVNHPYVRPLTSQKIFWQEGEVRIYDYAPELDQAPWLLLIPSLINPAYILDLTPHQSLVGWLKSQGIKPLLVDWGAGEAGFGMSDYVFKRLIPALDFMPQINVLGYCMGGMMAMALGQLRPEKIEKIVLLATPWGFEVKAPQARHYLYMLVKQAELQGYVSQDALKFLFTMLDPCMGLRKFRSFAEVDPVSERAQTFVALEDWVQTGSMLTEMMANDLFQKWILEDQFAKREFDFSGHILDPSTITQPTLVCLSRQDHITPYQSAMGLAAELKKCHLLEVCLGHVGMIVSQKAKKDMWINIKEFML